MKHKIIISPETRLQTSRSLLSLPLKPKHFIQRDVVNNGVSGQLRAKCLASMLTMHWQSEDIVITEESPTLASVVDSSDKKKNVTSVKSKKVDTKDSTSSSGWYKCQIFSKVLSSNHYRGYAKYFSYSFLINLFKAQKRNRLTAIDMDQFRRQIQEVIQYPVQS